MACPYPRVLRALKDNCDDDIFAAMLFGTRKLTGDQKDDLHGILDRLCVRAQATIALAKHDSAEAEKLLKELGQLGYGPLQEVGCDLCGSDSPSVKIALKDGVMTVSFPVNEAFVGLLDQISEKNFTKVAIEHKAAITAAVGNAFDKRSDEFKHVASGIEEVDSAPDLLSAASNYLRFCAGAFEDAADELYAKKESDSAKN